MLEGVRWRREQDWELAAWVTAALINVSGKVAKKTVTPAQLLGKKPKPKGLGLRDVRKDFEELMRRQAAIDARSAN